MPEVHHSQTTNDRTARENLKSSWRKLGAVIPVAADLSSGTCDAGRQNSNIVSVLGEKVTSVKIFFTNKDETTTFSDKRKLRICRSALQEMPKEILQAEGSIPEKNSLFSKEGKPLETADVCVNIKDYLFLSL